jgi:hypothetical protein
MARAIGSFFILKNREITTMKKDEHGHLHGADGKFTSEGKGDGAPKAKEEKKAPEAPKQTKEEKLEAAKAVYEDKGNGSAKAPEAKETVEKLRAALSQTTKEQLEEFVSEMEKGIEAAEARGIKADEKVILGRDVAKQLLAEGNYMKSVADALEAWRASLSKDEQGTKPAQKH